MKGEKAPLEKVSKTTTSDAEAQLNKEKAQLAVAKDDFAGLEAKLEADFKKELPNMLSEEEQDALQLGDDVAAQYEIFAEKHQTFVSDKLEEEKMAIDAFSSEIEKKQEALQTLKAEDAFKEKYPDVDFEEMSRFFEQDMSPAQIEAARQAAIDGEGDDHELFMENIMNAQKSKNGGPEENDPDLPADLSGIPGETGDIDNGLGEDDVDIASLYR